MGVCNGHGSGKNVLLLQGEGGEPGCCGHLKRRYGLLLREKEECRSLLEDLIRENEVKTRECREAQQSMREMRMELMRKSMHVGSLGTVQYGIFIKHTLGLFLTSTTVLLKSACCCCCSTLLACGCNSETRLLSGWY
jgi:hypothetical protein